jgi:ubiquinol-cytochrome c reductase cytochrome c subunit
MRKNTRTPRPTGRRSPLASAALLVLGLLMTGGTYALFTTTAAAETTEASQQMVDEGEKLFASNCASCHGLNAQGSDVAPSLIGVGAASVDFQVGTGRMPMARPDVQAPDKPRMFGDEEVAALAAYVASLAPGPAIPAEDVSSGEGGDVAKGGELFRVNCAMCHNFAGSGGALTRGKYAPGLRDVEGKHIYEAMVTGPQSMPVFNDTNITPEAKNDIIAYLHSIDEQENVGGMSLGNLGPVSEGLFAWVFGLGLMIAFAVWLGKKAA